MQNKDKILIPWYIIFYIVQLKRPSIQLSNRNKNINLSLGKYKILQCKCQTRINTHTHTHKHLRTNTGELPKVFSEKNKRVFVQASFSLDNYKEILKIWNCQKETKTHMPVTKIHMPFKNVKAAPISKC